MKVTLELRRAVLQVWLPIRIVHRYKGALWRVGQRHQLRVG